MLQHHRALLQCPLPFLWPLRNFALCGARFDHTKPRLYNHARAAPEDAVIGPTRALTGHRTGSAVHSPLPSRSLTQQFFCATATLHTLTRHTSSGRVSTYMYHDGATVDRAPHSRAHRCTQCSPPRARPLRRIPPRAAPNAQSTDLTSHSALLSSVHPPKQRVHPSRFHISARTDPDQTGVNSPHLVRTDGSEQDMHNGRKYSRTEHGTAARQAHAGPPPGCSVLSRRALRKQRMGATPSERRQLSTAAFFMRGGGASTAP